MHTRNDEHQAGKPSEIDALALELTQAAGRFARIVGRVAGPTQSAIAWRVLVELETAPARVSDLAQSQRVAQPTMTTLVQRLEREGLATRRADPDDRRAALITMTEAGRAALAGYRSAAAWHVRQPLAALSDVDQATLARAAELLRHISEGISDD